MKRALMGGIAFLVLAGWSSVVLAADPAVNIGSKEGLGSYLVDGTGKTLYWFTKDSPGKSACEGPCLGKWPAFSAASTVLGPGLKAEDFGMLTRADGTKQTTFRAYPLYYWSGDMAAGDAKGQGVNNVWFVIDPAKFPPQPAAGY